MLVRILAMGAASLALGAASRTIRPVGIQTAVSGLLVYCGWGLFQQYVLNGFFVNRLAGIFGGQNRLITALVAGAIFSALYLQNILLMTVTFPAGCAAALAYLRYRNLLIFGVAHGLSGCLIYLAVPDAISHHLYVGPNCILYCQAAGHAHSTLSIARLLGSLIIALR